MCRRLSIPSLARDELTSNAHTRQTLTGSQCLHYDRTERSPQERAWRRSIAASLIKLLFSAHEPSGGTESHYGCPGHTTHRVGVSHLTGITSVSGSPAKAPHIRLCLTGLSSQVNTGTETCLPSCRIGYFLLADVRLGMLRLRSRRLCVVSRQERICDYDTQRPIIALRLITLIMQMERTRTAQPCD